MIGSGDIAFRALEEDGLSQRGFVFASGHPTSSGDKVTWNLHILDWNSSRQRHKVYATWAAEIFNAVDTCDAGFSFLNVVQEFYRGVYRTPEPLRLLREQGGYHLPLIIYTDCRSIYSAVSSEHIKTPSERGASIMHNGSVTSSIRKSLCLLGAILVTC